MGSSPSKVHQHAQHETINPEVLQPAASNYQNRQVYHKGHVGEQLSTQMATISLDQRKNTDNNVSKNRIKTSKKIAEIDTPLTTLTIATQRYANKHVQHEKKKSSLEVYDIE